uniref:Uncharacterized protein n=1 Tax=Moniliophthora roreri TaxID=221103 RepID=A0A0W0F6R8_MONRR
MVGAIIDGDLDGGLSPISEKHTGYLNLFISISWIQK